MDVLMSNLKEMKSITIMKVLIFGIILSVLMLLSSIFSPDIYAGLIKSINFFSQNIKATEWKGVFPFAQLIIGYSLYVGAFFVFNLFVYAFLNGKKLKEMDRESITFIKFDNIVNFILKTCIILSLLYMNFFLFSLALGGELSFHLFKFIFSVSFILIPLGLLIIGFFTAMQSEFELQRNNNGQ